MIVDTKVGSICNIGEELIGLNKIDNYTNLRTISLGRPDRSIISDGSMMIRRREVSIPFHSRPIARIRLTAKSKYI